MAETQVERPEAQGAGIEAMAPVGFAIALAMLFVVGLWIASRQADGYSYSAGLTFSAFSIAMAARYFGRLLPK